LLIFATLITFPAYIWLLRVVPAARVSTYAYVNPVVALLLGSAIAHEPLTTRSLCAAALIIVSVIIVITRGADAQPSPQPAGEH
jgi:drug/metabolite transporter (DMT)-like permease